jgi:hypothetical protein
MCIGLGLALHLCRLLTNYRGPCLTACLVYGLWGRGPVGCSGPVAIGGARHGDCQQD